MLDAERLLAVRAQSNNYNSCPKHISIDACYALFAEARVNPEPKAVGRLGDMLENLTMALLEGEGGRSMSPQRLEEKLRGLCG